MPKADLLALRRGQDISLSTFAFFNQNSVTVFSKILILTSGRPTDYSGVFFFKTDTFAQTSHSVTEGVRYETQINRDDNNRFRVSVAWNRLSKWKP